MNDFDDDIKKALSENGGAGYDPQQENILKELLMTSFKGRSRFLTAVAWIDLIAFTVIAVLAGVKFFGVAETDVRGQIMWATIFIVACLIVSLVKLWWWTMAHRTAIQKDIRRVELRLVDFIEKQP